MLAAARGLLVRCAWLGAVLFGLAGCWLLSAGTAHAQSADLLVSKDAPATAPVDTDITYTLTVRNIGPDDATNVQLIDEIPSPTTFVSASQSSGTTFACTTPPVLATSGAVSCQGATLAANAQAVFSMTVHDPPGTPPGTIITNTAHVAAGVLDPNDENNDATVGTIVAGAMPADMGVAKVAAPANAPPSSNITYTLTLSNAGPGAASMVSLADTLPGDLTFVSLNQQSGPAFSCSTPSVGAGGTISCTASTYAVGATSVFTLVAHIPSTASPGTEYTNTVIVTSDDDPSSENNSATTTTIVGPIADLAVAKVGPASAAAGPISYTITATNNGPNTVPNVTLSDSLPPGTAFVSMVQNTGPSASCFQFTCHWLALSSGASAQFTLTLNVTGDVASVTNTATIGGDVVEANIANNSASATTTVTPVANLSVAKVAAPDPVAAGALLTYTVTVNNAGPTHANSVVLSDSLPAGTTFASASMPGWSCSTPAVGGVGAVTCTIATLVPGASVLTLGVKVDANVTAGTTLDNTATVTTTTPDPAPGNESATTTTTVSTSADLAIAKNGPAAIGPGGTLTYTVTVTNNGPSDAQAVSVADPTPAGLTFVSNAGACTTAVPCSLGTVPAAATRTITSSYTVPAGYAGANPIQNTATVSSSTTDPTPGNNSNTASTAFNNTADLAIVKTGPNSIGPGATLVYTITVTNNGPVDAQAVSVADPTPAGLTFVSNAGACTTAFPCGLGAVPSGATRTITASYAVPTTYAGPISIQNTATVSSATTDPTTSNNASTATTTFTTPTAQADLTTSLSVQPTTARPANTVVLTLGVANLGPDAATGVRMAATLPAGLTFVSPGTGGGSSECSAAGQVVTCTVGSLATGPAVARTVVAVVTANVTADTTLTTTMTTSGDQPDPVPTNNSASASLLVSPLGGTFSFSVASITVDDSAGTVTITVLNPSGRPGSVQVSTQDGTAKAGLDYTAVSTTLVFAQGETSKSVTIPILPRTVSTSGAPPGGLALAGDADLASDSADDGTLMLAIPLGGLRSEQTGSQTFTFSVVLTNPSSGSSIGSTAAVTVSIIHHAATPPASPNPRSQDNKPDSPRKETEEQRQQRERTNRSGQDDYRVEGNVMAVTCDADPPTVTIADRDGLVTVRLLRDAATTCGSIKVGDYLSAEGEKIDELLFEATDVSIEHGR
jgi:uncharacterized repeat protein (TIGR01451 family)